MNNGLGHHTKAYRKAPGEKRKQIAEIAQSEHIWNSFVRSELFVHAAPNAEVLNEACHILKKKLTRFAEGHPERERKEKALERLTRVIKNPTLAGTSLAQARIAHGSA